jgi:hypothetical protein
MGNGFVNIQDFIGNPNSANTLIGPNTPSTCGRTPGTVHAGRLGKMVTLYGEERGRVYLSAYARP